MRILSCCLLFLLISCKVTYRKADIDSISESEKLKVYNFGKQVMETCNTGKFISLKGKKVTKNLADLTLKEMQDVCDVLDKTNGKFIDMDLTEVIDDTHTSNSKIFRYKARFERNDILREVRVWLGTDGKFQGIICKTWQDEYEPYKKK